MPEKGGSSTVAGVEYQAWVATEFMVDAIFDETISIQLEGKADRDGKLISIDDIIIYKGNRREYLNCKHQAPGATIWTFPELKKQKIFDQLKEQYIQEPHQTFIFVTESPCPLLSEGFQRSASSSSVSEAKERLGIYEDDWESAKEYLDFSESGMLDFTRHVKYERKVLADIKKIISARIVNSFTGAAGLPETLLCFSIETAKYGRTVSKNEIIDYLKGKGFYPTPSLKPDEIIEKFRLASSMLTNSVSTIGNNIHIERTEVQDLVDWIMKAEERDKAACIIGSMGVGKTVVMKDLYLKILNESIPILAIKADCLTHIKSRNQLSEELGFDDDLLENIAGILDSKGRCVILIDQLDSLSETISKDRTALNIFSNIIKSLIVMPNVKVIASVRKFDLDNDPTLSVMPFDPIIEAKLLSPEESKEILSKLDIPHDKFTESQIELFRTPLHLRILAEIYDPTISVETLRTLQDMYDRLWGKTIAAGEGTQERLEAINALVMEMDKKKELAVSVTFFDRIPNAYRELRSNGIIIKAGGNTFGFFHQSFFDYCFARIFTSSNASLSEKVLNEHQGLFVRSQFRQTILFLRGTDPNRYIEEVKILLASDKLRYHLKDLLISLLGSQSDPNAQEIECIRQIFRINIEHRNHFLRNVYDPVWFDILNKDYLEPLLSDSDTSKLIEYYYQKIADMRTNEVIAAIDSLSDADRKTSIVESFLWELSNWTDEALELYEKYRDRLDLSKRNLNHIIGQIYRTRAVDAIHLLFSDLDRSMAHYRAEAKDSNNDIVGWDFRDLFEKAIRDYPDLVIEEFSKRLKELVRLSKYEQEEAFYSDRVFLLYERGETLYGIWKVFTIYINTLCEQIRCGNYNLANTVVSILYPTQSITLNRVLTWVYYELPDLFKGQAFELLERTESLFTINGGHNSGYDARTLLTKVFPYFSEQQKQAIEGNILSYEDKWEKENIRFRGRSQHLALSSIPVELLSQAGKKRIQELERKFGKHKEEIPEPVEFQAVGPPLPENAYENMSLDQWLSSFYKYDDSTSWHAPREDFLKGGVIEHSRAFKAAIQKKPDFFYVFSIDLRNRGVSSHYISNAIEGFVEAQYDYEKIRRLILHYSDMSANDVRRSIIRATESLDKREPIDSDLLEVLANYALNDPDPDTELHTVLANGGHYYYGGEALSYGINTVRGSAAMAITHHGFRTSDPERVFEILENVAKDSYISVRACLVPDLHGMLRYDKHRAFVIYREALRDMNTELLKYAARFLYYFLHRGYCCENPNDHIRKLLRKLFRWLRTKDIKLLQKLTFCTLIPDSLRTITPYLERIAYIDHRDAPTSAGRIAMIAYIEGFEGSRSFIKKMMVSTRNVRKGIADVCMANMNKKKYQVRCDGMLTKLIDRYMDDVDETVAWYFHQADPKNFHVYYPFLKRISVHINERRDLHFVTEYLSKSVVDHPEECIDIMKNLVQLQTENLAYNLTTDEAVTVVSSAYMKVSSAEYKEEAMDIIDAMYEKGYYRVKQLISAFER